MYSGLGLVGTLPLVLDVCLLPFTGFLMLFESFEPVVKVSMDFYKTPFFRPTLGGVLWVMLVSKTKL